MSYWLHPDRLRHPRAKEAFQILRDAYEWARDKDAWEAQRKARMELFAKDMRHRAWKYIYIGHGKAER
jgi:hypothetical protein